MPTAQSIIGNIKPNTKIYRIFPQMRFFSLFEERKNALLRPEKWDDPFENVFLKSQVALPNGETGQFGFRNDVYGQCWTLETASDAMWQIYSKGGDGIRVRTTVGKLIDGMRSVHGKLADVSCFIGRIEYRSEKELKAFGGEMITYHPKEFAIARSLLIKRKAYKHENEVRLIFVAPKTTNESDWVYEYEVDPLKLCDQAMVDGRVSEKDFSILRRRIAKWTGLAENQIRRSSLYTPPENVMVYMR